MALPVEPDVAQEVQPQLETKHKTVELEPDLKLDSDVKYFIPTVARCDTRIFARARALDAGFHRLFSSETLESMFHQCTFFQRDEAETEAAFTEETVPSKENLVSYDIQYEGTHCEKTHPTFTFSPQHSIQTQFQTLVLCLHSSRM